MNPTSRFAALRRYGVVLAAAMGLAAGIAAPPAVASTVTVGTTTCTYGSFTGDTQGNFVFQCSSGGGTTPSAGNVAFNLTGTQLSLSPSGTTTLAVTRTGATAGGAATIATVTATSGGCTVNGGTSATANFASAENSTSAAFTIAAPAAPATCQITLTASAGGVTGTNPAVIQVVDPNSPVAFQFSSGTSTAYFGGSAVSVTVTRVGGTGGGWSVPFTLGGTMTATGALVTGGGTLNPATGTLTFPAGSGASQTITFTPPATAPAGVTPPGTLSFTLGTPTEIGGPSGQAASLGTVPANTMSVNVASGCTTTATYTVPWSGTQTLVSTVKQTETAAVTRTGTLLPSTLYTGTITETVSTGDQADVQFSVSTCPGDFTPALGACANHTQYTGGKLYFSIGPKPASTPWYIPVCELPVGTTTVNFNLRQIKRPTPVPPSAPGTPSCQWTTCPVYVQFN